ncbi:MAG: 50S ribosomal protein L20 [Candidatus Omnitrophica bacterium]|nr:50S ribosomal protein L20 [Candidatus Omnitrophota bacterium]
MTKVKHSVTTHKRKKRVLKKAKGFWGDRAKQFQQARRTLMRAMVFAYRDRRRKKRLFRRLWITRLNAACRQQGITYSGFIHALKEANIKIDRKLLADLAIRDEKAFERIVEIARDK